MTTISTATAETRVNVTSNAEHSSVTALADGGYVVVWSGTTDYYFRDDYHAVLGDTNVYGRRYDAAGHVTAEFRIDADNSLSRYATIPSVSALADGGFVVGWTEEHQPSVGPYNGDPNDHGDINFEQNIRIYEADGTPGAIRTIDGSGSGDGAATQQFLADTVVAGFANGGFAAATSGYLKASLDLSFYDANGTRVGGPGGVQNRPVDPNDVGVAVASLTSGYTAFAWADSSGDDGDGDGIFFSLFGPPGQLLDAVQVNTSNSGSQRAPVIAALSAGGFVIAWRSFGANDADSDIRAQIYSVSGARVGAEFRVNDEIANYQNNPAIASLSGGGFVVAWETPFNEIHAQRFDADGARVGGEVFVGSGEDYDPDVSIAGLSNDRFVVTWTTGTAADPEVHTRTIGAPAAGSTLTRAAEIVEGGAGADVINAAPGTINAGDAIYGRGGADKLVLTAPGTLDLTAAAVISGVEMLVGTSGNDTFIVDEDSLADFTSVSLGGGSNVFLVKGGSFTLNAALNVNDIRASYGAGITATQLFGNGFGQKLTGSLGSDRLEGMGGADTLRGGGGVDSVNGGAGDDLIVILEGELGDSVDGGADVDTLDFSALTSRSVRLDLGSGTYSILNGDGSVFGAVNAVTGVENVNGGALGDFITGAALSNVLKGNGGADTIEGSYDGDTIFGGDGADVIYAAYQAIPGASSAGDSMSGDAGDDFIVGARGIDTIKGGTGSDTMDGGISADIMSGGAGNDFYYVDDAGDKVVEAANEGTDTVYATAASFTLAANIERLIFTDEGAHVAKGNALSNLINGNAGLDKFIIDAGGNDTFSGGAGEDTFDARSSATGMVLRLDAQANNAGSVAGDTFASVEKFFGSDTAADQMTTGAARAKFFGYGGNDTLTGGSSIDALSGGAGNDRLFGNGGQDALDGGIGNDTMTGGAARDVFTFVDAAFGKDIVTDFQDGVDKLKIFSAIADDIGDFTIAGNGTKHVVLTLAAAPANTITLDSAANINLTAADFLFY